MTVSTKQFLWGMAVFLLLASVSLFVSVSTEAQNVPTTNITIQENVWLYDAKRLGINIGIPDQFGAAQYLKNVIANPGFEAGEFATVFHIEENPSADRIQQDNWETQWNTGTIGQPAGFWNGAEYEVITGPTAGQQGTVERFTHEQGRYTYYLEPDEGGGVGVQSSTDELNLIPNPEDAVILRREVAGFEADSRTYAVADTSERRPDSIGRQSLRLLPTVADWQQSYTYYMDSFWRDGDSSAGKLLLVQGNWRFEVWAKGASADSKLEVTFQRQGQEPFMQTVYELDRDWTYLVEDFFVPPGADAVILEDQGSSNPVLEFTMRIVESDAEVWVDDIGLYRSDYNNPTVFSDKYVNLLKELNPGIVRNWGGQLGSSLDNQLALPWERRTTGHSPRTSIPTNFHYSLHEFLELARELDAEPWYVIPPTFTEAELAGLMSYLAGPSGADEWANRRVYLGQFEPWTEVFPVIHLEFGNEMWGGNDGGDPFIGATMRGGERLGQVAGDRIGIMKDVPFYDSAEFNFIIGGQFGFSERQEQIEENSTAHDSIALAPYFGDLEAFATDEEIFMPLFARPYQDVRRGSMLQSLQYMNSVGNGTEMSIYEINFHSTTGESPLSVRNGFVTGLNGGLALPLYMLSYQKGLGIRNQAAFSALQFSFQMDNGEYVRVWGMLRDLESTGRKRPTWLGVELANRAIRGNMLVTTHSGDNPVWLQEPINGIDEYVEVPYVQSFAFQDEGTTSLVLFNLSLDEAQRVILDLPEQPDSSAILHTLTANNIHHNNEASPLVNIRTEQISDFTDQVELILPPHSMHVLEWGEEGSPVEYIQPSPTSPPVPTPSATPTTLPATVTPTPIVVDLSQVTPSAQPTRLAAAEIGGSPTPTQQFSIPEPTPTPIFTGEDGAFARIAQNRNLLIIVAIIGTLNFIVLVIALWLYLRRRNEEKASSAK